MAWNENGAIKSKSPMSFGVSVVGTTLNCIEPRKSTFVAFPPSSVTLPVPRSCSPPVVWKLQSVRVPAGSAQKLSGQPP
jgi:hypothetical protein